MSTPSKGKGKMRTSGGAAAAARTAGGGGGGARTAAASASARPLDIYSEQQQEYGITSVGTLIVRIVAARGLPAAKAGGFFSSGSSNPYCILEFEGATEATSVVGNTVDPVWPREQYFFQVKMPAMHAETDEDGYYSSTGVGGGGGGGGGKGKAYTSLDYKLTGGGGGGMEKGKNKMAMFSSSEPHLHVMLVHKEGHVSTNNGTASASSAAASASASSSTLKNDEDDDTPLSPVADPTVFTKPGKGGLIPPGDRALGEAFVNIVDLATARTKSFDEWFPLSEGGAVRLVVEYDVLEPPPQPGEVVRLLGFGAATDLWPLPLREEMLVEKYVDANRDRLLVSYMTPEGWKCKAEVHRFHVLSAGRHQTLVDEYQDKFLDAAINFMETPAMHAVGDVLDKVCDGQPLDEVAKEVLEGMKKGLERWWEAGFSTTYEDVTRAFRPIITEGGEGEGKTDREGGGGGGGEKTDRERQTQAPDYYQDGFEETEAEYQFDFLTAKEVERISCPITGLPMRDPVTAADNHTYERSAILRWFDTADTSPMIAKVMATKTLYDCRAMRETIEEYREINEQRRKKAQGALKTVFGGKGTKKVNVESETAPLKGSPSLSVSERSESSLASSSLGGGGGMEGGGDGGEEGVGVGVGESKEETTTKKKKGEGEEEEQQQQVVSEGKDKGKEGDEMKAASPLGEEEG